MNKENRNGDKIVETTIEIKTPSGSIVPVTSAIQLREVMRETFYLNIRDYDSFFRDFVSGDITIESSVEDLNAYGLTIIDDQLKRKAIEVMKAEVEYKRLKMDYEEFLKNKGRP